MKSWKVIIKYNENILELKIEAKSYSDAYLAAENKYPGCIIKSITAIANNKN